MYCCITGTYYYNIYLVDNNLYTYILCMYMRTRVIYTVASYMIIILFSLAAEDVETS